MINVLTTCYCLWTFGAEKRFEVYMINGNDRTNGWLADDGT
jgi:hypothetical protein